MQRFSLKSGLSHIQGSPTMESSTRKMSPNSRFQYWWDLQDGCRKIRSHSWRGKSAGAISWDSPSICPSLYQMPSSEQFPSKTKATLEIVQLWGIELAKNQHWIWMKQRKPLLVLTEAVNWGLSQALTVLPGLSYHISGLPWAPTLEPLL